MVSQRLRDLAPSGALVGTELFYSDDGAADVKVTATKVNSFVHKEWFDLRDFGAVLPGTNIFPAFQATVDHIKALVASDPDGALRTIFIPNVGGVVGIGSAIDWGTLRGVHVKQACEQVYTSETIRLPAASIWEGITLSTADSGATQLFASAAIVRGVVNADPVFFLGDQNSDLITTNMELINIGVLSSVGSGLCIKLMRTSNCNLHRVTAKTNGAPTGGTCVHIDSSFWIDICDCFFGASGATMAADNIYSIKFTTTAPSGVYTGLIYASKMNMSGSGIGMQVVSGGSPVASMIFEDCILESAATNCGFLDIIAVANGARDITLNRCSTADNVGSGVFGIRSLGGARSSEIRLDNCLLEVASDSEEIVRFECFRANAVSTAVDRPNFPLSMDTFGEESQDHIDKRLHCAPRTAQSPIGTVINVPQDSSSWSFTAGDTLTSGQLAPDGTLGANKVQILVSAHQVMFVNPSITFHVGDWVIGGAWLRIDGPLQADAGNWNPAFNMTDGFWTPGGACTLEGVIPSTGPSNGDIGIGEQQTQTRMLASNWRWFCQGFKFLTIPGGGASAVCALQFIVRAPAPKTFYVYNPCLQVVLASDGFDDQSVINAIRSYRGGWAPSALVGDVGALDHMRLSAGAVRTPISATKTIATGAITVTGGYHLVDTEAAAASDDLDTVNGGKDGMRLVLRAANSARTVVVKDGTGNIQCAGDFSLDNTQDTIELIFANDQSAWLEIGRSDNGA